MGAANRRLRTAICLAPSSLRSTFVQATVSTPR
jgi:hypothetical protein